MPARRASDRATGGCEGHTWGVLLLLLACGDEEPTPQETEGESSAEVLDTGSDEEIPTLEPLAALTRLSLDLRGRRPTLAEIERVQEDPAEVDALAVEFLDDRDFPDRMGWLWNEAFHTGVWGQGYTRFGELDADTWAAMGWEPLAFVSAVTDEDRPFTDLVTMPGTRADDALADFYGLSGGGDWGEAFYTDGRPNAGVLATNALWLRYTGDAVNYNRSRANAVARIFLCADFLDRDGSFEFDLDPESLQSVEDAVATEPACLGCHAALDPLTGFFGGFAERSDELPTEQYLQYSPYMETWHGDFRNPSYYGTPASDLSDLGELIAADPRFSRCAVRRFYEGLVGELPKASTERQLLADWKDEGLVVRALVEDIVATDAYLEDEQRVVVPGVLYTTFADLLSWSTDVSADQGLAPMGYDAELRVMAGGPDDDEVLARNRGPHLGMHALTAWAARSTSSSAEGVLQIDPDTTDPAAVRDELARLHLRFFGAVATEDDLDALEELHGAGGFEMVVAGLLRHPRSVIY